MNKLALELKGNVTLKALAETLTAANGLLSALTAEIGGDPDAVSWELTGFYVACDRCGQKRSEDQLGWKHANGEITCPGCSGIS